MKAERVAGITLISPLLILLSTSFTVTDNPKPQTLFNASVMHSPRCEMTNVWIPAIQHWLSPGLCEWGR